MCSFFAPTKDSPPRNGYATLSRMIFVLIGHRGVGKTSLLARIAGYYRDCALAVTTIDLDREIEARSQRSIAAIFAESGEAHFRALEQTTLHELVAALQTKGRDEDIYIALGAGFSGGLPAPVHAVWIRRETDALGRIFVDPERPRLSTASPRQEYLERFSARQKSYAARCDDVFCLREGVEAPPSHGDHSPAHDVERAFVMSTLASAPRPLEYPVGGVLSLLPEDLQKPRFQRWMQRRRDWPDVRFELRDDLLQDDELSRALAHVPVSRRIFSFRRTQRSAAARALQAEREALWDFPLELLSEQAPPSAPPILSLHERLPNESLQDAAARLVQKGAQLSARILKFAVEVRDFAELLCGYAWAQREPARRAFLPRSPDSQPGRWRWFRLLTGALSPLAFFREGAGTSLDQPLLAEWWQLAALRGGSGRFAAVLGEPVEHSRTPVEHAPFFAQRALPVLAIPMSFAELSSGGLDVLRELGLRYAAVTAPLKRGVASILHTRGELSAEIESVNTLYYSETRQRFFAQNTDQAGAAALLAPLLSEPAVAVWGGGGTLPVLRAVLPHARYFSSRTAQERARRSDKVDKNVNDVNFHPTALVWASGRAGGFPDVRFKPRTVYDLSYGEDSAGREYALRIAARYVSGLQMFVVQAAAQREFFAAAEKDFEEDRS
jgi:shikimate 5-dehydrogenase/shikimate kinase